MSMQEQAQEFEQQLVLAQEQWNRYCSGADEVLEEYQGRVNGDIIRWRDDTPSRILTWQTPDPWGGLTPGPRQFSISLQLDTKTEPVLKVNAAAWRDDEEALKRNAISLNEQVLPAPISPDQLRELVTVYGHTLRAMFGLQGQLLRELKGLQPELVGIYTHQTDLAPRT